MRLRVGRDEDADLLVERNHQAVGEVQARLVLAEGLEHAAHLARVRLRVRVRVRGLGSVRVSEG